MSTTAAITPGDLASCFRRGNNTSNDNYFNYVLIFVLYVLDWVISEKTSGKINVDIDIDAFLKAARLGEINAIRDFFLSITNEKNECLIYDSENNDIRMGNVGKAKLMHQVGAVPGMYYCGSTPKFESLAMHFLGGRDNLGIFDSLINSYFKHNTHLSELCTMLCNQMEKRTVARVASIFVLGGNILGSDGSTTTLRGANSYEAFPEHCVDNGLLKQSLDYLVSAKLITSNQKSSQVSPAVREENSNNHCDSVKEKLEERPYIAFFIIAAAALLAGGAVALTTYFHVGTTLMLAGGFIPFLKFVGGFQISLLLGVVVVATASAGVCVAIKKADCCKLECCEGKGSDVSSNNPEEVLAQSFLNPGDGASFYNPDILPNPDDELTE